MEKTFLLTEEQQQNLYEVTKQVHGEMFEAICTHNDKRFYEIIASAGYKCNNVDAICVMRWGTPQMQDTYWRKHTRFSGQAEVEMFLHADAEFVESILDNWLLETENFKAILKRDDIKIIAAAINFAIFGDDEKILTLLQERSRPLELALYYNRDPDCTPTGFWLQDENVKLLENNLELFNDIAPNILSAIIDKPELRKKVLQKKMFLEPSAHILIALHQAKTTEEEIRLLLNDFNPSISDFDRLYQYSNELFELVVKNCEIYWDMLWECKEKLVFISKIAELRLTAENVSEAMFDNPNGADLVWVLKEKALWNKEYLCLANKYPALLYELRRYLQFNKEVDKAFLDNINIWKLKDFTCAKAYIEKFGIDIDDEHYIEYFNNKAEREALLCLIYDKCGLRSQAGKRLWLQYCKHNPKDKRIKFIDYIKAYFC